MIIDPEKGIHVPTLVTATTAIAAMGVYSMLIQPNFPFLIELYFPGVYMSVDFEDLDPQNRYWLLMREI